MSHLKAPFTPSVSINAATALYNDASDTVLLENNRVTPDWGCNPF